MSLDLDDETRAQLGFRQDDDVQALRVQGIAARWARDAITMEIDGRHRARDRKAMSDAYWARHPREAQ